FVVGDRARRLEPVGAGHDDVHEHQVWLLALRLGDPFVAVVRGHALVALLGQRLDEELAVRGGVVDDQDLLDWHGGALLFSRNHARVYSPILAHGGRPMRTAAEIATALVALLHVWFLVLEMFLWTRPFGLKTFGLTPEAAAS